MNVAVCAVTVFAATSTPLGIEAGYYEKALHWDERQAERPSARRLGWTVTLREVRSDEGRRMLVLEALDADGQPVSLETAAAEAHFAADPYSTHSISFDFNDTFGAPTAPVPPGARGAWDFRINLETADQPATVDLSYTL